MANLLNPYDGNTDVEYYLYCEKKLTDAHNCFSEGQYYPVYTGGYYTENTREACGDTVITVGKGVQERAKYEPIPKDRIVNFIRLGYDVVVCIVEVEDYDRINGRRRTLTVGVVGFVMAVIYFIFK